VRSALISKLPIAAVKSSIQNAIIHYLRLWGASSRSHIAEELGISRATTSEALQELLQAGWLTEVPLQTSLPSRGRRPTLLSLKAKTANVLGASYQNLSWTLGIYDLLGNEYSSLEYPVVSDEPEVVFGQLCHAIEEFSRNGFPYPVLPFIGIGSPGLVNMGENIVEMAADLGWLNVSVNTLFDAQGRSVAVINRHRARGLAECRYGAARNYQYVVYVGIGSGVAAGIYVHRQFFGGAWGAAGELGHVVVDLAGPVCACGNKGCLQTLVSEDAILTNARNLIRQGHDSTLKYKYPDISFVTLDELCAAANSYDAVAYEAIKTAVEYLGVALANLVNIVNPDCIVIGGRIVRLYPKLVEMVQNIVSTRVMGPTHRVTVIPGKLLKHGETLGAAEYAMDALFSYPPEQIVSTYKCLGGKIS
jgi:predicted NBD/HSP70 family sugar kinase